MGSYNSKKTKPIKVDGQNLSPEEGEVIKKVVNAIVDFIVKMSGGNSSFGKK